MKALLLAGLVAIAQPAAAQVASVDIQIGTPGWHYRTHYRHGHRFHARVHGHRAYARYYRRPYVIVAPRPHYRAHHRLHQKRYYRWY
jgi:hypothetical protein